MGDKKPTDVIADLLNIRRQAQVERSHYYTAEVLDRAIAEIIDLRDKLREARKS